MTFKRVLFLALVGSAAATVGCGDDGDGGGGDTDAGDDTGVLPDISVDTDTGTNTCESGVACERSTDCRNADLEDYICGDDGCCVPDDDPTLPECARHLADCEADEQSNDNFICDTTAGQCIQRCNVATTESTRGDTCPTNSYCFDAGLAEPPVSSEGEVLDGACVPGDCTSTIFDDTACADNGTCLPVGNGASFCVASGSADVGEPCGRSDAEEPPADDICAQGLLCFRGTCAEPCDLTDDASCGDGTTCIEAFDTTTTNQPGVCGVECGDFSGGECGDGLACTPAWGRFGLNAWLCSEIPGTPGAEGDECDIDQYGNFADCQEGLLCLQETEDGPATCTRFCDPLGESEGALASCGGGSAGPQVLAPTEFGNASAYVALADGSYAVDLRLADGTLVAPTVVDAVDGEQHSVVATGDADGELDLLHLIDLGAGDTLPPQGIRALHAAAEAGEVDAYLGVVFASDLALGDSTAFAATDAGDYNVILQLADGTEALSTSAEVAGDEDYLVVAHETADGSALTATVLSWPTGEALGSNAALRAFHAVSGAPSVDVYVNCGTGGADCADADPVLEGLAFGASAEAVVPSGEYSVWIYAAGDVPGTDDEIFTTTVMLGAGIYATAIAYTEDGEFGLNLLATDDVTPPSGESYVAFAHAADGAPAVDAVLESHTSIGTLDYADTLEGDASSYVGLEEGTYTVAIRAADSATDSAALLRTGAFDLAADDYFTAIVTWDAADELTAFFTTDLGATLEDGEGAERVVHAFAGVGAVAVHLPGDIELVCPPSGIVGLGFCQDYCDPYPRGGDYGCGEGNTCVPFLSRDDEPVEPQGFCSADEGGNAVGEDCENAGYLGNGNCPTTDPTCGCSDLNVCLEPEEGAQATCTELCEPFSETADQCGAGSCSAVPPLLGNLNLSFCVDDVQEGGVGDECEEAGFPCAQDGTLCITLQQGGTPECVAICREGFDDCANIEDTACEVGVFGAAVPDYMGICF